MITKKKAITIKEIKGTCIKTIPIGTKFTVSATKSKYGYSTCQDLEIDQIWNNEYKLMEDIKMVESKDFFNGFKVIKIDSGDNVVCDSCNKGWTNDSTSGGFIFSSNAYCPDCSPQMLQSIRKHKEEKYIKATCKKGQSFADFVREYRKGGVK